MRIKHVCLESNQTQPDQQLRLSIHNQSTIKTISHEINLISKTQCNNCWQLVLLQQRHTGPTKQLEP
jgi:hypothetical protein